MSNKDLRKYSKIVVDGVAQSPSRAMLRAVGFERCGFQETTDRHRFNLEYGHPLQHAYQ